MKKLLILIMTASLLILGVNSVIAEEIKGIETKSVFSSDKADGNITSLQSGATIPSKTRPARVVYVIQGGDLERIYPDGKIVKNNTKLVMRSIWINQKILLLTQLKIQVKKFSKHFLSILNKLSACVCQ